MYSIGNEEKLVGGGWEQGQFKHMSFLEYTRLNAILHVVLISVGVFGIEVSAQAALQDGTVVAELTVQIPSVSSFCHSGHTH